jgi:hypothetical protein
LEKHCSTSRYLAGQADPGIFSGKLYSKWYVDADNLCRYDDTQSNSDDYMNNAYIGTWKRAGKIIRMPGSTVMKMPKKKT